MPKRKLQRLCQHPTATYFFPENCSGNDRQHGADRSVTVPTAHQTTTVGIVVEVLHTSCMSWPGLEHNSETWLCLTQEYCFMWLV